MSSISSKETAASGAKRTVLLVDDHPVVFESLSKRLNAEKDLAVCHQARSAADALAAIVKYQPNLVVIELALGDGDALELTKNIRSRHRSLPVIAFTRLEESSYALRFLQAGGRGYVAKKEPFERLLSAIRTALNGGYAVSPETSTKFLQTVLKPSANPSSGLIGSLGQRELDVFELLGRGMVTREIAAKLGCGVKTIETYRARIKTKLGLPDSTALVREAVRWVKSRPESI